MIKSRELCSVLLIPWRFGRCLWERPTPSSKSRAEPTFFGLRRRPWSAWGSWWRLCSRERTSWPNSTCTGLSWDQTSAVTKLSYFSVYCGDNRIESKVKFFSSFFLIESFSSNKEKIENYYISKYLSLDFECIWAII